MERESMVIRLKNNHDEPHRGHEPILERPKPPPKKRKPPYLLVGLSLVTLALIIAAFFWFTKTSLPKTGTSELDQSQISSMVEKVGKHILLPTGEQPTVATVSDLNPLKDQLFFKNAKVGNMVLMYPKARRAILYDPLADKIIEVAPITVDAN